MWPPASAAVDGKIDLKVAQLGNWGRWLPAGWRLSGQLDTTARITGQLGAPELSGELVGRNLAVRNLLQGVDVRDGELALSLRGSEATIDRFVFKGGTGELRLTGGASLGAEPRARLQLTAERFKLLGRIDRRIVASGDATLLLAPWALAGWQWPDGWFTWLIIATCGLCGGLGHFMVAQAHRYASAATLGPFLYQQIIYMTLWGWLVFNQVPDAFVVAGAAVVVGSGLYLLWLEIRG